MASHLRHFTNVIKRLKLNIPIDAKNFSVTHRAFGQDLLMQSVKASRSRSDLLDAVSRHIQVMNHKHLMQVLRTLADLHRHSRIKSSEELTRNPTFMTVCQNLKKNIRALSLNETVDALKFLFLLNVPVNSVLYQSLLQILRHNLNHLDIEQVMFLDYMFSKVNEKNHLIEAYRIALPLVFQIHLPTEIDTNDLHQLRRMLMFSCKHRLPDKCLNSIVTCLILKDKHFNCYDAKSIVWSLCDINITEYLYPSRARLMKTSLEVLAHKIHELSFDELLKTVSMLRERIINKHMEYYNELFMDAAAEYVIMKKCDFESTILIARSLSRIAHFNRSIVQYMCDLVAKEPEILASCKTNMLFAFVNCLSNAYFIPPVDTWNKIKKSISDNPVLNSDVTTLPWVKLSLELASLGHYEEKLIRKIFDERFLMKYLSRQENMLDYVQTLTLRAAVNSFTCFDVTLPTIVIDKAKDLYPVHPPLHMLSDSLCRGLGGEDYFVKDVQMDNGIIVDYLVSMQKGGIPLAINKYTNGKISIGDLNIPKSCLVIPIMVFYKSCYSLNNNRLRGTFQLLCDILDKEGNLVLPINIAQFLTMPEKEVTPYLMNELNYRCENLWKDVHVT